MRSADIVIFKDVFMQNIIQVLFIENNDVVETLSTKCTKDSFTEWILPWASWCSCVSSSPNCFIVCLNSFKMHMPSGDCLVRT